MSTIGAGILSVMPLHSISEVHGESGLRQRLELESEKLSEPEKVGAALDLASRLHRDDRYGREPYVNHLLRVAIRIVSHYEVRDTEVVVAGLLHDSVEDHPGELAGDRPGSPTDAALAEVGDRFGERVANIVAAVTNPIHQPGVDRHEQYREHVAASLARDPWARVVKISDFTDNGVGIVYATGGVQRHLATKYRPLTNVYRDLVTRPDTPLAEHVKQHILDQLDRADERFHAILGEDGPSK
ncbi:HD domain-containing protein [Nocardia pseudobrasiliensis]|uniref:HD domain-containing protein n=1 Tax=Nocardia pseudobrasiliensis TaxID=45979 RepID=A0A370I9N8_9NOCA|nr:HD domain-containing protein [Nocardia pseudobrasiliensis]RDI67423.1 HD domain-containing protein [Nocardia pseudobrasiliensis]